MQQALAGVAARASRGRCARALERTLVAARRDGLVVEADAGIVAVARSVALALDGAMAGALDARDVTELARELRQLYAALGLTPSKRAERTATTAADPLEALFASLDVPTPGG